MPNGHEERLWHQVVSTIVGFRRKYKKYRLKYLKPDDDFHKEYMETLEWLFGTPSK